jgi:1-acyl-sn-glycerol-3-phosphate acyltransferase
MGNQAELIAGMQAQSRWKEKTAALFKVLAILFFALPATLLLGGVTRTISLWDHTRDVAFRAGRLWAQFIMLITGGSISVEGLHNIDSSRCYVFVANHQSFFDIVALMGYLPIQFCWVAKKKLFKLPFFGKSMASIGSIPIDHAKGRTVLKSLETAVRRLREGRSILIFPEGSRSHDGQMHAFKPGAFYLAQKAGCPVVPLVLVNTECMMPHGAFTVNPCHMKLIITPAIAPDPTSKTREQLAAESWQRILSIRERYAESYPHQRTSN